MNIWQKVQYCLSFITMNRVYYNCVTLMLIIEDGRQTDFQTQYPISPSTVNMSSQDIYRMCQLDRMLEFKRLTERDKNAANGISRLIFAMKYNKQNICKRIIASKGVRIDLQDNEGWTALHYGCLYNSVDCVKLLLQHPQCCRQFVEIRTYEGETAIAIAERRRNEECAQLIKRFINFHKTFASTSSTSLLTSSNITYAGHRRSLKSVSLSEAKEVIGEVDSILQLKQDELKDLEQMQKTMKKLSKDIEVIDKILHYQEADFKLIKKRQVKELLEHEEILNKFLLNHREKEQALEICHQEERGRLEIEMTTTRSKKKDLEHVLIDLRENVLSYVTGVIPLHDYYVSMNEIRPSLNIQPFAAVHALSVPNLSQIGPN